MGKEFAVEYIDETEKGLLIFDGDKEVSLPKSQTKILQESDLDGMMLVEVPEWLAIKEGLI